MTTRLLVDRLGLVQGLKVFRKLSKAEKARDAILSFDNQRFVLSLGGVSISAEASGDWAGEARIPGSYVIALASGLPKGDPLRLEVEGDRLRIGSDWIRCKWQSKGAASLTLPMDSPIQVVLRVAMEHSPEAIAASGFGAPIAEAEVHRDRLVEKAARILDPLGVSPEDVRKLVDDRISQVPLPPSSGAASGH